MPAGREGLAGPKLVSLDAQLRRVNVADVLTRIWAS